MTSITTTKLFRAALAAIALHVADDNFFHPEAGTSATDHLISGLVPLALLALAAWGFPRLRGGAQGALALFIAPLGIATGIEAVHYANQVGASGDDFTGFLAIPAGLLLIALGARRSGARAAPKATTPGATRAARSSPWPACWSRS